MRVAQDEKPWTRGRAFLFAVLFCTGSAILYGLIHDQITIRMAPEYFTVYHPRLIASDDLTLTALAWGITATWFVGLLLGCFLGLIAVAGDLPTATKRELITSFGVIFVGTALAAIIMGTRAWFRQPTSSAFTVGDNLALTRVQIIHITSYLAPIPLAILMSLWMIFRRYQRNLELLRVERG